MMLIKKVWGFTLIEMVITLAILGLLTSLAVPTIQITFKRQKEHELKNALREIRKAIDAYKQATDANKIAISADDSGYPPNLMVLYKGAEDATDPSHKKKIYFLRRLPRDPFYPDGTALPDQTWGKRSYESNYDHPKEGKDVYDIYSYSQDSGLNGIPYKDW